MTYVGSRPANKAVTTSDIEDDAITSAKIATGTVVASDLGANSVDSSELVDGSVDLSHLSATGTKSSSTYLRGDNSFATVSSGTALTGSTNNQVTTVTGANAIVGEANLQFDGEVLKVLGNPTTVIGQDYNLSLDNDTDGATSGNAKTGILFRSAYNDNTSTDLAGITAGKENTSNGEYGSFISLNTRTNGVNTISERMHIDSTGKTCISNNNSFATSYLLDVNGTGTIMRMNRSDDGAMLLFQSAGSSEGYVAISGSTCTYYTFTGGHWSQLSDLSNPTVLKGTVIETIDEMCEWYVVEITRKKGDTEEDEIIKVPHILQVGQSVGDTITVTYEGTEYSGDIVKETNNNLAKVKISDSEDSKAVYGVFQNWDEDNDMSVVALGTFVVRVHKDETVAIGDLLSSKGDGTAKVQADDIMRSRTIAKVTSTIKQTTYDDGSYTVPCTLHCG